MEVTRQMTNGRQVTRSWSGSSSRPTRHLGPGATALERQEEREAAHAGREAEPITEAGRWNAFARECNDTLDRARDLARGAREAWGGLVRQAGDLAHQLGGLMRSSGGMEALAQGMWERSPEGRAELRRQEREAQAQEERQRAERSAQERGGRGRERGRDDDWSR